MVGDSGVWFRRIAAAGIRQDRELRLGLSKLGIQDLS
jgi:hypothetical protein